MTLNGETGGGDSRISPRTNNERYNVDDILVGKFDPGAFPKIDV